jgi:hypothetical protein
MFAAMARLLPMLVIAAASLLTVGIGCSVILSFDEDKRPCGADDDGDKLGDCLEGYLCMVNQCVAEGSVERGKTCTVSAHCEENDVCAVPGFVCRQPCSWAFGNHNQCDGNTVCIAASDFYNKPVTACVESLCQTTCTLPDACVQIKTGLGRCLKACTLSCSASGCTDTCGRSDDGVDRSCQPVGINQTLVCLPAATASAPRAQGDACNFADKPCDQGYACIVPTDNSEGICLSYCSVTSDTHCPALGGGLTCQEVTTLGGDHFGICQD